MAQRLRARLFVARSSQISSRYTPRSRLEIRTRIRGALGQELLRRGT